MVRSKRENFACTRRKDSRPSSEGGFPLNNNSNNSPPMRQSSSPDDDDWSFQMMYEEKVTPQKTSSSSPDDPMGNALPSVPAQLLNEESSRTSSFDAGYCSSHPSSSTAIHPSPSGMITPSTSDHTHILQYYLAMETGMCSRRRIMYTNTDMDYILDSHATL
uniref:Uncharacterized protein n=2 Tax=Caenorhabditis japonica TaxID=281687 RepID=A0A8R1ITJ7_CAEJA